MKHFAQSIILYVKLSKEETHRILKCFSTPLLKIGTKTLDMPEKKEGNAAMNEATLKKLEDNNTHINRIIEACRKLRYKGETSVDVHAEATP